MRIQTVVCAILLLISAITLYLSISADRESVGSYLDFFIFTDNAKNFLNTGQLYQRDLSLYGPGAAIYKYPPLYGALLTLSLQQGMSQTTLSHIAWLLQIACWLSAFFVIIRCSAVFSSKQKWLIISTICIYWFANDFFRQNAYRLQLEPYLLLILALALYDFNHKHDLRSGIWIGLAAMLKIYPLFLMPLFVILRRWHAITGMAIGCTITLALTLPFIGWDEHVFYWQHIFPTLMQEGVSGFSENISIARMLIPFTMIRPELRQDFPQLVTHIVAISFLVISTIQILITQRNLRSYSGSCIDFSVFYTVMLVYMQNFWWNYQIMNLLPGTIIICLCIPHIRHYILPFLLFIFMLIVQITITIPELWIPKFSDLAFDWLGDPNFIVVRGSIQILLISAALLAQLIFHSHLKTITHKKTL